MFEKFVEQLLHDDNGPMRFTVAFAAPLFFGALGFILEKSPWTAAGFALIPCAVLAVVLVNGSFYIQDIYEIDDYSKTFNYLLSALFGSGGESIKISGGKKMLTEGEVNTLDSIGGPGFVNVEPGNAVILETLLAPSRILGAGEHKVFRNEIIKDVVSLEECYGRIDEMVVATQDGIDVKVGGIEFRFLIDPPKKGGALRSPLNPYPFSVRAVYNMAYGRAINESGKLGEWNKSVEGMVRGVISDHVSTHDLDTLTTPAAVEKHPLEILREKFYESREKFKSAGANLLWVNIGSLSVVSADIDAQRYNVWSARQTGSAKVMRAQGESENISSRERGRAEGQVVLLKSIAQALNDINIGDKDDAARTAKNLWNIVLARTAQILESMTSIYSFDEEKEGQNGSERK
jgi:hypothetical protein